MAPAGWGRERHMDQGRSFRSLCVIATSLACLTGASCPKAPAAVTPTLTQITGFGRWAKATATTQDQFFFAIRPEEKCPPGGGLCSQRYPDTAFVDFSIPSLTGFEVLSGTETLAEVGETAPVGDYQYRRAQLTDGSGATTTWRIAVSVPAMLRNPAAARTWCNPTTFPIAIVNVSGGKRSGSLPLSLVWGRCQSDTTFVGRYSTGKTGTPPQSSAPTPTGDCPGGAFAKSFDVCERCGTSGLSSNKTLWGCDLADAKNDMGLPGCVYTLRTSVNCP